MSLAHKAFLFDGISFANELKPIIEAGLISRDVAKVRDFISDNLQCLVDPYEGEPLGADWETMIETPDIHQYGDFALTKYYSPILDRGVGASWENIQQILRTKKIPSWVLLGSPVGVGESFFDPGKAGSYFQMPEEVEKSVEELQSVPRGYFGWDASSFEQFKELLIEASNKGMGVYVTF